MLSSGYLPALFILNSFLHLWRTLKWTSEKTLKSVSYRKTWQKRNEQILAIFWGDWSGTSLTSPRNVPTEIHERIFLSSFRHGISRLSFLIFLFANQATCSGTTKRRRRQSLNVWHGRSLFTSVLVSCSLSSSLDYAFCSHRLSIKIELVLRSTPQFARIFRAFFRRSQVLMRSLEGNWLKCH